MAKKQRRTFNAEFKLQVVQLIRQQGLSVGDVYRRYEAWREAVQQWRTQADEEAAGCSQQRIRQLEAEYKQLCDDTDIPKSIGLLC